ncbi:MAG TPA: rhamnogalacturonan acetylesterase [Phycisphaerae bacterium]|nr:rhamnogalacturonan acetylesterase [Phycisphaerae bacterium]
MHKWTPRTGLIVLFSLLATPALCAAIPETDWKFSFGNAPAPSPAEGVTHVSADAAYDKSTGYGFEPGASLTPSGPFITSKKPFYFSAALPEGNYNVTLTLGNPDAPAAITVKAELRRLMLESIRTTPDKPVTRTITVNIRTPEYEGGKVHLKPREVSTEILDWDEKLTLEINGTNPGVSSIEITKVDCPTVYILGDSTVCDQPAEPYNSWGQMLTRFLKPGVAVSNQAESGESLKSSKGAHRFDKVLSEIKAGDYLFIQYGHNDMKEKNDTGLASYTSIYKKLIEGAKAKGATPVVVTSMNRKSFDKDGHITNSFINANGDYIDGARRIAREEDVPLIDLNEMSRTLYEAIGPEHIQPLFANSHEGTHHSNYGSYEMAKCIVLGIQRDKLDLARFIADDWTGFDPAKPDPIDGFDVPVSPVSSTTKPLGN